MGWLEDVGPPRGGSSIVATDEIRELRKTEAPPREPRVTLHSLMEPEDKSSLSSLLRPPSETPAGLETDQLRAATRSALFGQSEGEVRVGRFILGGCIGQGAMGTVFRAHDPDLGRDVALKVLEPIDGGDEETELLLAEARTLAQLNHPNVVTVHECGVDRGRVYIAMEYVEGGTFADWLRRHPPDEPGWFKRALDLATQATAGLAAAHAVGLIHRDLKPNNMLVDADGRLRIADFGLARTSARVSSMDITLHDGSDPESAWTKPAGTPGYIAPEQLEGRPTAASDQFSLCATLYEVFAGTMPFRGRTAQDRLDAVRERRFESPRGTHSLPRWLRRVLERGLAERPGERFENVQALLSALERGRGQSGRRRMLALGSAGVAVVGGVSMLGVFGAEPSAPVPPCADGSERLVELWSPERAEGLQARVLRIDGAYSSDAWSRISETLESWSGQWSREYQDACEATKVRGEQSARTMQLKMRCLERQLVGVDATLERVGATSLPTVVSALVEAPRPIECRDADRLEATLKEPEDARSRAEVDAILRSVQAAQLALLDTKPEAALEASTSAVTRARVLAHGPTLAEALVVQATMLHRNRQPFEVEAREAVQLAAKHDLPEAETDAWLMVSRAAGVNPDAEKRDSDTSVALQAAQAALARAGQPPHLAARVTHRRAETAHTSHSDLERGVELYAEALELYRAAPGPSLEGVGYLIDNYVQALSSLGRHEKTLELCRWRLEYAESRVGPEHPESGRGHYRLAMALYSSGELDEAEREAQRALQIAVEARVPDSSLAGPHGLLGAMAIQREDWTTARVHVERKLEIYSEMHDGKGMTAGPLKLLGELELSSGNPQLAKEHFQRALQMSVDSFGPENPWMESMREALGRACMELGEFKQAAELFALVVPRLQQVYGADTPFALRAMAKSVEAHLGLDDLDAARRSLAEIKAVEATVEKIAPEARVDVALARAAFDLRAGTAEDAKARLVRLREGLLAEEVSPGKQLERTQLLARVDRWMAEAL